MRRPSLFHWLQRWFWGGAIVLSLLVLGTALVNVVDGFPFWNALRRIRQLDQASLQKLAEACSRYEKDGHQRLLDRDIPPEFRALKPVAVSIYPGSTDITLFEHSDFIYVFLRVSTHSENQTIECVSSGPGRQNSRVLWERNPEFTRRLNPRDRVVTIRQMDMRSGKEWIVRLNELIVIERTYTVGGADRIAARIPLQSAQRARIETAIAGIGPDIRGHAFDSGAADGVALRICFTSDGKEADDILLANAWRNEVAPLIDAITGITGKEDAINFPDFVRQINASFPQKEPPVDYTRVSTLREHNRRLYYVPHPWWRLWPRLDLLRTD